MRLSSLVLLLLFLLNTGCAPRQEAETTHTPSFIITSTLPITPTALSSETVTPLPTQPTATQAPVEGVTSTQVNVRAEPSTASNVLGMIPGHTKVEITGQDPGESWFQINYPAGHDGTGWVTAQYITTTAKPDVPIVGGTEYGPNRGNVAIVQQQLNVRSGPGTDFNALGTLNPQDVVGLIGKDANGAWLQINFESGPEGKGWVNAAFVQAKGVENLPIVTETGRIVGTGTPTGIPFTPTPTLVPAWDDHDSPSSPIASVIFEPTGTQALIYQGDVSSPQGDSEDWIAFQPDGSFVFVSLRCNGSTSLKIEMTEDNRPVDLALGCNDQMKPVPMKAGSAYLIHLQIMPSQSLQYVSYTLVIKSKP